MAELCSITSRTGMASIILFFSLMYLSFTARQSCIPVLYISKWTAEMQRFQLSLSYISTQHIESITQVTLWIYDGVLCDSEFGCLYCLSANSFKRVLYTQRFAAKLKKILFQLIIALNFCQIQKRRTLAEGRKKKAPAACSGQVIWLL